MNHLTKLPESWSIHFGAMGAEAFRSGINTLLASGKARIETCMLTDAATNKPRRAIIIELGEVE